MEVLAAAVPDHAPLPVMSPSLAGVDGPEVADAFAVLGVLAHADVDLVLPHHGGGDDLVGGAAPAQDVFGVRAGCALNFQMSLPVFGSRL